MIFGDPSVASTAYVLNIQGQNSFFQLILEKTMSLVFLF